MNTAFHLGRADIKSEVPEKQPSVLLFRIERTGRRHLAYHTPRNGSFPHVDALPLHREIPVLRLHRQAAERKHDESSPQTLQHEISVR